MQILVYVICCLRFINAFEHLENVLPEQQFSQPNLRRVVKNVFQDEPKKPFIIPQSVENLKTLVKRKPFSNYQMHQQLISPDADHESNDKGRLMDVVREKKLQDSALEEQYDERQVNAKPQNVENQQLYDDSYSLIKSQNIDQSQLSLDESMKLLKREENVDTIFLWPKYEPSPAAVKIGEVDINASSTSLHRVLRKFYYTVLLIIMDLKDTGERKKNFIVLHEELEHVVGKVVEHRVGDATLNVNESNAILMIMKTVLLHNKRHYDHDVVFPVINSNPAGKCASLVDTIRFEISSSNHIIVNRGALNRPSRELWMQFDCPAYFEKAQANVVPYDDDDGVDISPPLIISQNKSEIHVLLRGSHIFNGKELLGNDELLMFYRCTILKIRSVPNEKEKNCYFKEFDDSFLKFFMEYMKVENISGVQVPNVSDNTSTISKSKRQIQQEMDMRVTRVQKMIASASRRSGYKAYGWIAFLSMSKQKLIALGCLISVTFVMTLSAGIYISKLKKWQKGQSCRSQCPSSCSDTVSYNYNQELCSITSSTSLLHENF